MHRFHSTATITIYDELMAATKADKIDDVKRLVEAGAYTVPTLQDRFRYGGHTPLHVATRNGCLAIVNLLLTAKDADVNVRGDNMFTPLHLARVPEIVSMLIAKGATVDVKSCHGYTPLHFAVSNNKPVVAKLLIDNGASPYKSSNPVNSVTPLQWATGEYKNDAISDYMLAHYKGGFFNKTNEVLSATPLSSENLVPSFT